MDDWDRKCEADRLLPIEVTLKLGKAPGSYPYTRPSWLVYFPAGYSWTEHKPRPVELGLYYVDYPARFDTVKQAQRYVLRGQPNATFKIEE